VPSVTRCLLNRRPYYQYNTT